MRQAASVIAALACLAAAPAPDAQQPEAMRATAAAWSAARDGGVVILYAVPETQGPMDAEGLTPATMPDCARQPNLTLQGQARARAFGRFLAHNEVKLDFANSPMSCAGRQTVALIAQTPVVEWHLLNPAETLDPQSAAGLEGLERALAASAIADGRTRLLVAHGAAARRLAGRAMAPGEAVALRFPAKGPDFRPVEIGPLRYSGGPPSP